MSSMHPSSPHPTRWRVDAGARRSLRHRYPRIDVLEVVHFTDDDVQPQGTRTLQKFAGRRADLIAAGLTDADTLERLLAKGRDGRHRMIFDEFGTAPYAYEEDDGRVYLSLRHLAPDAEQRGMHGPRAVRQFRRLWRQFTRPAAAP